MEGGGGGVWGVGVDGACCLYWEHQALCPATAPQWSWVVLEATSTGSNQCDATFLFFSTMFLNLHLYFLCYLSWFFFFSVVVLFVFSLCTPPLPSTSCLVLCVIPSNTKLSHGCVLRLQKTSFSCPIPVCQHWCALFIAMTVMEKLERLIQSTRGTKEQGRGTKKTHLAYKFFTEGKREKK